MTNLEASKNKKFCCYSSAGQKSEISATGMKSRCPQGHTLSRTESRRDLFLAFSSLWWVLAFPGLWLHHSHLYLSLHIGLSSPVSLFFSLLSRHLWCRHGEQTCGCQGARGVVGGMDWESGISRCKLLRREQINKVLLYSTGKYTQYPVINHNGKEYEKEDTYIYI